MSGWSTSVLKNFKFSFFYLSQLCCCYFCCFVFVFLYVQYAAHGPYTSCSWYDFEAKRKINENDFCLRFIDLFAPQSRLEAFLLLMKAGILKPTLMWRIFYRWRLLCSRVTHSSRITCLHWHFRLYAISLLRKQIFCMEKYNERSLCFSSGLQFECRTRITKVSMLFLYSSNKLTNLVP